MQHKIHLTCVKDYEECLKESHEYNKKINILINTINALCANAEVEVTQKGSISVWVEKEYRDPIQKMLNTVTFGKYYKKRGRLNLWTTRNMECIEFTFTKNNYRYIFSISVPQVLYGEAIKEIKQIIKELCMPERTEFKKKL